MKFGKKKKDIAFECSYHKHSNYYNHAGFIPCNMCNSCIIEKESLERLKRFNLATDLGAKPNR